MRHYTQLTHEQRYQIYALKKAGHSQTQMARIVGVHKSTVCRELQRNSGRRGYRPRQAHLLAMARREEKVCCTFCDKDWRYIEKLIRLDWSPEQISLWLGTNNILSISHETIYQYIYRDKARGGDLYTHLRCKKKRRKRYGHYDRRGTLVNQRSINERPVIVEKRTRMGDWELDTIIGKGHKQAIVSIVDRTARLTLLKKVKTKDAKTVRSAIVKALSKQGLPIHTLTSDNGREFGEHETVAKELEADFYFAHPYSSWERGTNENANGLVRQYLPKGTDFTTVTQAHLNRIMKKLNNRPRKCLGMRTPNQVAFGLDPNVALTT